MSKKGASIVEIIVVIAILTIGAVSLLGLVNLYLKISILSKETIRAQTIAQETLEAIRNFRDNINWTNDDPSNQYDGLEIIATNTAYYPEKSADIPPQWMLILGEDSINEFTRKAIFEDVSRDPASGNIEQLYSALNHDPDTKKVTVAVSWKNKQIEIIAFLTNWQG